jgi:hypothetical protein
MIPRLASERFLDLLAELERYPLPPRRRVNPGDEVGGRLRSKLSISGAAMCIASEPERVGGIARSIVIQPIIRGLTRSARQRSARPPCPSTSRASTKARTVFEKGARPKRSAEVNAAVAEKLREQRDARVTATLPLVEEARAHGCLLLREICQYLDDIGHKPQKGERWSVATLSRIVPTEDPIKRDRANLDLIEQAIIDGCSANPDIADWLNARGCRTGKGTRWSTANVQRLRAKFRNDQSDS